MNNKFVMLQGIVLVTILTYAPWAQATLGGTADTVTADRKALSAVSRAATPCNGYTVEELAFDSTTVREYVSPAGIVFGLAWNGYVHPDLTQLLGSYAQEYAAALEKTPRIHGRNRQKIVTNDLVVEKWGHMRDLRGRAYAPALVPSGVSIDEIK